MSFRPPTESPKKIRKKWDKKSSFKLVEVSTSHRLNRPSLFKRPTSAQTITVSHLIQPQTRIPSAGASLASSHSSLVISPKLSFSSTSSTSSQSPESTTIISITNIAEQRSRKQWNTSDETDWRQVLAPADEEPVYKITNSQDYEFLREVLDKSQADRDLRRKEAQDKQQRHVRAVTAGNRARQQNQSSSPSTSILPHNPHSSYSPPRSPSKKPSSSSRISPQRNTSINPTKPTHHSPQSRDIRTSPAALPTSPPPVNRSTTNSPVAPPPTTLSPLSVPTSYRAVYKNNQYVIEAEQPSLRSSFANQHQASIQTERSVNLGVRGMHLVREEGPPNPALRGGGLITFPVPEGLCFCAIQGCSH